MPDRMWDRDKRPEGDYGWDDLEQRWVPTGRCPQEGCQDFYGHLGFCHHTVRWAAGRGGKDRL